MPVERGAVLLTGATGFVGMELLARYLERTERPLYALVRAADERAARSRLRATLESIYGDPDADRGRVRAVPADLTEPGLGLDEEMRWRLAAEVTDVVHGAASVSFELPLAESRRINVEGTRRMLELAQLIKRRGALRRFSYISTAYVAGEHAGSFDEHQLDVGQRFRNAYEQSKFEAERLVRDTSLPVRIFRPSIIVGERDSGWTASFNVLYWPLRAFARGGYMALPARSAAPVDVVPVDYVADAIFALAEAGAASDERATFHLTAGEQATTVGEVAELAAARFRRRRPSLLPPRLYRRAVHPLLVRSSRGARREKLRRTETFFPYFAMRVSYDDRRARQALEPLGIRPAPLASYFDRLVDFALQAQWGRRPIARAQACRAQRASVRLADGTARPRLPSIGQGDESRNTRSAERRSGRDPAIGSGAAARR
jgi:long-chain acyl-CoA synthetase